MKGFATAAAALLAAQPALAADAFHAARATERRSSATERRSSAFAGVQVKLPIGTARPQRASARLQLTAVHERLDVSGAAVGSVRMPGLKLGLDGRGRASFHAGGRELRETQERLGAKGSTTTWLIVGGVVVFGVIVLAAVAGAQPVPGPGEGDFN